MSPATNTDTKSITNTAINLDYKTFALKIAYNGGAFSGFAPQKSRKILSVSEAISDALQSIGIKSSVLGAGRTDKGVHSLGMVVRFFAPRFWEAKKLEKILAPKIYPHIKIRALKEIDFSFCPIKDAKKRAYLYLFSPHLQSPFVSPFVAFERVGDMKILQKCLQAFIGEHNFALFRKSKSSAKTTNRIIYDARLKIFQRFGQKICGIYIEGNGFLRAQVRLMIGASLAVSRGEVDFSDFILQLEAKKSAWREPVSANGLYFAKVWY
ncbi:tRNA pseudouridine(38-40) synthase TruA [Helicobacter sp. T3_23-1059]